ncbi:MAG: heat-shock protein [Desulfobulbus propionicus]|nr:MAG: heat-shock protein [Desulfobulbus propionicus]
MSENKAVTVSNKNDVAAARQVPIITPNVDIYENESEILLHADMPGVSKEDISINIDEGRLHLSGSRTFSDTEAAGCLEFGAAEYSRIFTVPQSIDVGRVKAHLNDGVLELKLPKHEAAKPKHIEITTS